MKKGGLSPVVGITLVVMLSVAAATVLFMFIVPSVDENLEEITQDRVTLSIETEGGYTLWDSQKHIAMVQVKRGNDELELEAIKFRFYRGETSLTKENTEARPDTYGLPEPGQKHVYIFDLSADGFWDKPERVRISAIVAGEEQEISDETGETADDNKELISTLTEDARTLLFDYEAGRELCIPARDDLTGDVLIYDCADLQCMDNNLSASYRLMKDLDCMNFDADGDKKGFDPIGSINDPFVGSFDGQGFTISNLLINRSDENYVGVFGYTLNSEISRVNLLDINVTGKMAIGGLVGSCSYSSILNSSSIGTVESTSEFGNVGGLVGSSSQSSISQSYTRGFVGVSNSEYSSEAASGGLIGSCTGGSITNSYSTTEVSGSYYVGGLAGERSWYCNLEESYATGNVSGINSVGGLSGYAAYSSTINSYATGNVNIQHTKTYDFVGGLTGDARDAASISNAFWYNHSQGISCYVVKGVQGNNGCIAIPESEGIRYFYNVSNEPLASWDFNTIWQENAGAYPTLR